MKPSCVHSLARLIGPVNTEDADQAALVRPPRQTSSHPARASRPSNPILDQGASGANIDEATSDVTARPSASNVHPMVVQERARAREHRDHLGIYSHVAPTMHDQAAETVAGMITLGAV